MTQTNQIVQLAVNVKTMADVVQLEVAIEQALGTDRTRCLGDSRSNFSAMDSPGDATSVWVERVTNMQDANLELEAQRRGRFDLPDPAAAAAEFFGVAGGVDAMAAPQRAALARRAVVSLRDSDNSVRQPTLAFRDVGLGMTPAEMPNTILSLLGSNKLSKQYLHGIFGKGGSSVCPFGDATVVVTRKQPDRLGGAEDRVSVVVIREDDAADAGLPFYRYQVGADDLPFSVPAADVPGFEPGTLVVHVNYQAGRMGLQNWNGEESIYAMAETILFRPTLPYSLLDERTGSANVRPAERRDQPGTVWGLAHRLDDTDGLLDKSNWSTVAIPGVGNVRMRWWLFESVDRRRRRAAKGYVVLFTTNGQVHHTWDQARLQYMVKERRRVAEKLLVEVDCDGVDLKKRVKVFGSFRAQVRKGPEGAALEEAIAEAIRADADLEDFESEFVRQSLKTSAQAGVSSAFRDRLNRYLKVKIAGIGVGGGGGGGGGPRKRPPRPKPDSELYPEPTAFSGPEVVTAQAGGTTSFYLEANAVDGFIPDRGAVAVESNDGGSTFPYSVGDLRKGRHRVGVAVPADAQPGVYGFTTALEWVRSAGGLGRVEWALDVQVVARGAQPAPNGKAHGPGSGNGIGTGQGSGNGTGGTGPAKNPAGDVAFLWSHTNDQTEWSDNAAGDLQFLKGSDLAQAQPAAYAGLAQIADTIPTIVLNQDFADWSAYKRAVAGKITDAGLAARSERYALAVGVAVANLYLKEQRLEERAQKAKAGAIVRPMNDDQKRRAVAEAARGFLAVMPDFDTLLGDLDDTAAQPAPAVAAVRAGAAG